MNRLFVMVLTVAGASSCAPVLLITRPVASEGTFGSVRTLSVDVATDMKKAVEHSVLTGLVMGEIPIPVPVNTAVKNRLVSKLQGLGYVVCEAPCGDGTLQVRLTESSVNSEFTRDGPRVNVRLAARAVVHQNDGREPYDFSFWANRSGRAEEAGLIVQNAAEAIASRFEQSLVPGTSTARLPLEDGGELTMGVNYLLSGNLEGALGYLQQLTQSQPQLAGAWYDLGVAWEARGDWGQALTAYERAAALQRKNLYLDAVVTARRALPPAGP